ncbi:MAG: hypothetical protein ACREE7_09560, partial [Dongiaceae bacterium]
GEIVGQGDGAAENQKAFIWDAEHGIRDLNLLLDAISRQRQPSRRFNIAAGINNRSEIVITPFASYGTAVLYPFILGDLNCDGVVNLFDADGFVLALLDRPAYLAAYPDCRHEGWAADVNQDAVINNFDIQPFIELLLD